MLLVIACRVGSADIGVSHGGRDCSVHRGTDTPSLVLPIMHCTIARTAIRPVPCSILVGYTIPTSERGLKTATSTPTVNAPVITSRREAQAALKRMMNGAPTVFGEPITDAVKRSVAFFLGISVKELEDSIAAARSVTVGRNPAHVLTPTGGQRRR